LTEEHQCQEDDKSSSKAPGEESQAKERDLSQRSGWGPEKLMALTSHLMEKHFYE